MRKKSFGAWLICGALLVSSATVAVAQPPPPPQHGRDDRGHGHPPPPPRHDMYERGHREGWYRRGGRVPSQYRGGTYVVSDWRGNHLRPPPRGYHWVRSDNGDFLLVAVTTGIIASILAHH